MQTIGTKDADWLESYSHDLMETGEHDQEAGRLAAIAKRIRSAQAAIERLTEMAASAATEANRLRDAAAKSNEEICQTLGRALGYPRFCDDQKNFPGTTDTDGVAVGDHVAETLAIEAAELLKKALADNERLNSAAAFHDAWKADAT